jgi:DNA mismatch repair protein MutL
MKGQYPVTFLFLEMDAEAFDINVHPAKKEVRFHDGFSIRDVVAKAIRRALENANKLPEGLQNSGVRAPQPALQLQAESSLPTPTQQAFILPAVPLRIPVAAPTSRMPLQVTVVEPDQTEPNKTQSESARKNEEPPQAKASPPKPAMPTFRIIGILHRLYVLMESTEGLVLMDQHAAHERVNFEKIRAAMEAGGVPSQRLLMPVMLQTSPRDGDILKRNLETLTRLGIEAEPFGPNTFKIEALPTFLKVDDPLAWLDQVIEELQSLSSKSSALRLGEDMIVMSACRHSVKANDKLSIPEVQALLEDLFACEMPYCCPHGRPTLIQMSMGELERKFGRAAP